MRQASALEKVMMPIVNGLGFTWVGLQYVPGRRALIRLYIDKPGGVNIDDCATVSRQVNAVLGVENVITEDYTLEVSSPGLDRLLFTVDQCSEQVGKLIAVRLIVPVEGKRNFKGRLLSVEGEQLTIASETEERVLSFSEIAEARVVPEW